MTDTEFEILMATIETLAAERDRFNSEADDFPPGSGMREVKLIGALNAAACLGRYTKTLLDECRRLRSSEAVR